MSKQIEALKLALEALEFFRDTGTHPSDLAMSEDAITAIKEALMSVPDGAQPSVSVEQSTECGEPVAYQDTAEKSRLETVPAKGTLLYTTPPPVAEPHKRPSRSDIKPLTDEQIEEIAKEFWLYPRKFVRAIEAAHNIKGEA